MPKITGTGGAPAQGAPSGAPDVSRETSVPEVLEGVLAEPEQDPAWGTLHGYADWTLAALRDELAERGLPKSGNKAELVQRLVEADEA